MRFFVWVILAFTLSQQCEAKDAEWPNLLPGKVEVLNDLKLVPSEAAFAAKGLGVTSSSVPPTFTFFRTSDGLNFLALEVSSGESYDTFLFLHNGREKSLFPLSLVQGDPKSGYFSFRDIGHIRFGQTANEFDTEGLTDFCESGHNIYSYKYKGSGIFALTKVVYSPCQGKNTKVLYSRAK